MTLAPAQETTGISAAHAALSARLDDPTIAGALSSLLDRADLLAVLLDALDGFIGRSEVIGNSLADGFTELRSTMAGNENLQKAGADIPRILDTATRVVSSDLLDPAAVDRISVLARGLVRGGDKFDADPVSVGGPLSLLKLLKDPDINRAISYFATVAKAVGQEISNQGVASTSATPQK